MNFTQKEQNEVNLLLKLNDKESKIQRQRKEAFTKLLTSGDIIYKEKNEDSKRILQALNMKIGDKIPKTIGIDFANIASVYSPLNKQVDEILQVNYYLKTENIPDDLWYIYNYLYEDIEYYHVGANHTLEQAFKMINSDPMNNEMFYRHPSEGKPYKKTIKLGYVVTPETDEFSKTHEPVEGHQHVADIEPMVYFSFDFEYFLGE